MQKEILEQLIGEGLSSYRIAKRLGMSQTNVRHFLTKYQLKTSPIRPNSHPQSSHEKSHNKKCYAYQKRLQQDRKREIVLAAGGKCMVCGYNKNYAALEFHHRDPKTKTISIDAYHLRTEYSKCKEEVNKCDLLYANCHRELHHPEKTLLLVGVMVAPDSLKVFV